MTTEAQLKSLCLKLFRGTGWSGLDSSAIAQDVAILARTGYEQLVPRNFAGGKLSLPEIVVEPEATQ
jgi:hypothetical protein